MMNPTLGSTLHISAPTCVHGCGPWAAAGAASSPTNASPATNKRSMTTSPFGSSVTHDTTYVGERLLAGAVLARHIGGARLRHGAAHGVNLVDRYFAHLGLDGRHAERRRLHAEASIDAGRHERSGCGDRFDSRVDACLHPVDV